MSSEPYSFTADFNKNYISKQKPPPPSDYTMKPHLQSYPPLGQVTVVATGPAIDLTAVLRVPASLRPESCQVALWSSADGAQWSETSLNAILVDEDKPSSLQTSAKSGSILYFACSVSVSCSLQFTFKIRTGPHEPWTWVRDDEGFEDGLVSILSAAVSGPDCPPISDMSNAWKVASLLSQAPQTLLWSLESNLSPANGDVSSFENIDIGMPWGSYMRWFALVRVWSPWLAPRQGKTHFVLDQDAIICSFLSSKGRSLVFLALNGLGNVLTTFCSTADGRISVNARNDDVTAQKATVLVAESHELERAVAAVMYHARALLSKLNGPLHSHDTGLKATAKDEVLEEKWYDGLGYCTWNGLGQKLTEQKVLDAVQKLVENKIHITSLIIDDNWQSIDYKGESQFQYGWVEFEADAKAFPRGLKALVSQLRRRHPSVQHISVWHSLLGYWGGIAPGGKLEQEYKTLKVDREQSRRRNLPLGGAMTVVAKEDVDRLYQNFYDFLCDAGIDGVKTDSQFMVDVWPSASVRRELINTYLDSWAKASLEHFGARAISCMSQIPQALFHCQLVQNRPPTVVRNSDDFFPEVAASHPWHIWTNAHNAVFTQFLNVLPDWDMFQTVHDYSDFHAAARCVSGGPIYITDVPGKHNMDLIWQMTGITPKGQTIIFRPSVVGRSMHPYTGYDDDVLLKVGSYHGRAQVGTGILGVFNVSARALTDLVPLSSFPGTLASLDYIVRAHTTGKVSMPMKMGQRSSLLVTWLDVRGYEIYCAYPLTRFTGNKHNAGWTSNLGLVGKMTGCAAIVSSTVTQNEHGRVVVETQLKALGVVGIYVSTLPTMTIDGDFMATLQKQPVPRQCVKVSHNDACVVEVDIERAWRELRLDAGPVSDTADVMVAWSV
ncbi:hypothetical protein CDD81_4383 [Ophiocordyceps australis]|uniref:Alpha-galactosidase n=1 Tax=Ophiocordyceps australis TaxID=1399860 RepID=A0A2C5XMH4_9HYPO|nr:hypothetical protein CDD81_4383 [Ophiocordyceps australis]